MATDCDQYLGDRLLFLKQELETVNNLAMDNDLPHEAAGNHESRPEF